MNGDKEMQALVRKLSAKARKKIPDKPDVLRGYADAHPTAEEATERIDTLLKEAELPSERDGYCGTVKLPVQPLGGKNE